MRHDKLVRDRIPEIIRRNGAIPVTHHADAEEYWRKLKEKLEEEVAETLAETDIPGELADVLEVIHAICAARDISFADVERLRQEKRQKRGGFTGRLILEETVEKEP